MVEERAPVVELFLDGIQAVGFAKGLLRADCYTLSGGGTDSEVGLQPERKFRLLMTPQAFLDSLVTLQNVARQLEEAGVIVRRDGGTGGEPATAAAAPSPAAPQAPAASPNFGGRHRQ